MRITKTEARRRAAAVLRSMKTWSVHTLKADGTIIFCIQGKRAATYIEFAPEHWAAFDAVCNS